MTEAEWLASDDPETMLAYSARTDRKMRAFACAATRQVLRCEPSGPVELMAAFLEAYAEGRPPPVDLDTVKMGLESLRKGDSAERVEEGLSDFLMNLDWFLVAGCASGEAYWPFERFAQGIGRLKQPGIGRALAWLVRDVFGPTPYHPPTPIAMAPLAGQVITLAQAAYDEREMPSGRLDRARLAVLSDALEEAGCTDEAILTHLRSPGPHVRGCWAVDLVLCKS